MSLLRFVDEDATAVFGVSAQYLLQRARAEGRGNLEQFQADTELDYLAEKKLLNLVPKTLSPEIRHYRISAEGRDYLAQQTGE